MRPRRKLTFGLIALAAVAVAAYYLLLRPTYDYIAGASGIVVSADGSPVPGVRVRFKSAEVVYQAISPLRSAETVTDAQGRFAFSFISCGKPGGPYRLTLEREGLRTVIITGTGSGKHRVVMQSASQQPAA